MAEKQPNCPKCESENVVPILYGYPGSEMEKDALKGKIVLGGCVIGSNNPKWCCNDCHHKW